MERDQAFPPPCNDQSRKLQERLAQWCYLPEFTSMEHPSADVRERSYRRCIGPQPFLRSEW